MLFFSMALLMVMGRMCPLYLCFFEAKEGWIHSSLIHCLNFIFSCLAWYFVLTWVIYYTLDFSVCSLYPNLLMSMSINFLRKGTDGFIRSFISSCVSKVPWRAWFILVIDLNLCCLLAKEMMGVVSALKYSSVLIEMLKSYSALMSVRVDTRAGTSMCSLRVAMSILSDSSIS